MSLNNRRNYRFDEFDLQLGSRLLVRDGKQVALGSKAFDVLVCLVVNAGEVVTKADLLKSVWSEAHVEEGTLSQHVFSLRKALGDRAGIIKTIPGRGYQFTAAVQEVVSEGHAMVPENSGEMVFQHIHERAHFVIEDMAPQPVGLPAPARSSRSLVIVPLLLGAFVLAGAGWTWTHRPAVKDYEKAVVADIVNTTGDGTFDATLKRALEIDLEQSPFIDVMSESETSGILQRMGKDANAAMPVEVAREVCVRDNRQVLLTATLNPVGQEYLLMLEATDCNSGKKLAGAKACAPTKEKIFTALDIVTDKVRSQLGESDKSVESYQVPIAEATTPSLEALKAYSIGKSMEDQGKEEEEILPLFQEAVKLDPQFAMAYGEIGNQHYNLSEYGLAAQFYKKAFDLSDHVSAKEKLVIKGHYYAEGQEDLEQGIRVYELWAATYPHDWVPWVNMANEYTQIGEYGPAISAGQHALQLEPDRTIVYSVLARAYKRANRFADANATGAEAIRRSKDGYGIHGTLYTVAWLQHDIAAQQRETKWCEEKGGWYAEYYQALSAASEGKYRRSEEFFHRVVDETRRQGLTENPDEFLTEQASIELRFGYPEAARSTLEKVDEEGKRSFWFALDHAELGDTKPAEAFLKQHAGASQHGTIMTFLQLPQLRAIIALDHHRPADAVAALEPATPYQMAGYDILTMRGEAYRMAGQPTRAAAEYQKLLENRGISFGPGYPLARLGLARAYAAMGNKDASRGEYQHLLADWKAADPDLPVLLKVKAELAQLH
jgi:DNA-binding winged helix-turn-helix (wHTH) protein/predicted Zn-dependent protease